jgi:heme exporter protein B
MSFLRQMTTVARRDLRIEGRAGEVGSVVLPFAAAAVFVVPLATNTLEVRLSDLAWPVYWLVALLFGMQVSLRQTGTETQTQRRHLVLLGIDPAARFAGRTLTAAILMLLVLVATAPLVVLFYNPDVVPPVLPALGVLVLFSPGLAMLATLAGDVTVGLRARSALAPLLVAPLAVPLLVGGSRAFESLARGDGTLTSVLLLVIVDLALAASAALTARSLENTST